MKKSLLLSLFALLGMATLSAKTTDRATYVTYIESCEAILQEFQADPATAVPAQVLQQARAIVIANQFKAGFLLGLKDGYAVILVKKANGRWSVPAILRASEASLGLQLGANSLETVMIITNDETPKLLFNSRFNVGVDAKAVAGPKSAETSNTNQPLLETPVLIYTKTKGLFAGASLRAGQLNRHDDANFSLYHTTYRLPELLYSDWVEPVPEVVPLMNLVQNLAP